VCTYQHVIIFVGAVEADLDTPGSDAEAAQDPGALADSPVAIAREGSSYFSGWMLAAAAAAAQAGNHQLSLRAYPPTFQWRRELL
jgi:predicted alpha-1,6-mannanase (GH76 family)